MIHHSYLSFCTDYPSLTSTFLEETQYLGSGPKYLYQYNESIGSLHGTRLRCGQTIRAGHLNHADLDDLIEFENVPTTALYMRFSRKEWALIVSGVFTR